MATALALLVLLDGEMAAQAQSSAPVIPGFWDPARRSERPPAGSIAGIRFVTTDDFPPFNFSDPSGRLTGFNIDLARAICTELDVKCTIQARPWDDLIPSITEKRSDAAIAGIAISDRSRKEVTFSDVYLRSPARFVVRRGLRLDISPQSLSSRTIAVVDGTAHRAFLQAFFPEAAIQPFPNAEAARQALRSGRADALFGDGVQLAFWLQGISAGSCCVFAGGPYLEPHFFGEGFAIALRPDDSNLRHALNGAMEAIYSKGIYAELYLRYFPVGFY